VAVFAAQAVKRRMARSAIIRVGAMRHNGGTQ